MSKPQSEKFTVVVNSWCPHCEQRHELEIDLCDGNDHRCTCCTKVFKLPSFVVIKHTFDRLSLGRARKRATIKGRK